MILVIIHTVLAHASARWRWWSAILEGRPIELARDGRLDLAKLRRNAISGADLAEAMRQSNVTDVPGAKLIVLEPSGKITLLKQS